MRRTVGQRIWVGISSAGAVVLGVAPTPAVLLAVFARIFSISTFVVGPAITTNFTGVERATSR